MPTARPFARNTGAPIAGTQQVGNLAVGTPTAGFAATGLPWWNGPDEDLGYVIATQVAANNQPTPVPPSVTASVGFWRSTALTDASFIEIAQYVARIAGTPQTFVDGLAAKTWLNANGYWTSFIPGIVTNGLVYYIDAGDPSSYPGSGATWFDISGNSYNSSISGGSYSALGGGSILFSGSFADSVSLPANTNTRLLNNYQTFSQWLYVTGVGPNNYTEMFYSGSQYSNFTAILWTTTEIGLDHTLNVIVPVPVTNNFNEWMNITCTLDKVNNVFEVYKNGAFVGSVTFSPFSVTGTTTRLASNLATGNSDNMRGNLATTMIYNKILNSSEVAQNFNAQKARFGL